MKKTIFFIIFVIGYVLKPTASQFKNPEDYCINDGDIVCVNCITSGTCDNSTGRFTIIDETFCDFEAGEYCDSTLLESLIGLCNRYSSDDSTCVCENVTCIQNPNTGNTNINCADIGTPFECDSDRVITSSCTCSKNLISSSTSTTYESTKTSEDKSPTSSTDESTLSTDESTTATTPSPTTTAEESTTSTIPTTTMELTTTPIEIICPDDCPFADDPTNDCRNYYQCTTDEPILYLCPDTFCFNQDACQCLPGGSTTPLTCPDDCPLVDDPKDDCSSYYSCANGDTIQYTCPSEKCFDQNSCGCIDSSSQTSTTSTTRTSTTTTLTTSTTSVTPTCTTDCPFMEIIDDDCQNFNICGDNGDLTPAACPGLLCFDQELCQCVA